MEDIENVWLDSGMKVPVGRWAHDPCRRCGRQPTKDEIVKLDWMAHTVLCATCDREDQRGLARALAAASKQWWAEQAEHNGDS
jgi:hypothetical protein